MPCMWHICYLQRESRHCAERRPKHPLALEWFHVRVEQIPSIAGGSTTSDRYILMPHDRNQSDHDRNHSNHASVKSLEQTLLTLLSMTGASSDICHLTFRPHACFHKSPMLALSTHLHPVHLCMQHCCSDCSAVYDLSSRNRAEK